MWKKSGEAVSGINLTCFTLGYTFFYHPGYRFCDLCRMSCNFVVKNLSEQCWKGLVSIRVFSWYWNIQMIYWA